MSWKLFGYFLLAAVVAYCCGNFNGALLTSHFEYKRDIREYGSGNAGLTNFYRIFGAAKIVTVVLIDLTKAIVAVLVGGILLTDFNLMEVGRCLSLLLVATGHIYPATYDFRGGKGVLSVCGAMLIIDWRILLAMGALFAVVVLISRYISLGSICMLLLMPVVYWFLHRDLVCTILLILSAALIIFMHRANIVRIFNGTENKFKLIKSR